MLFRSGDVTDPREYLGDEFRILVVDHNEAAWRDANRNVAGFVDELVVGPIGRAPTRCAWHERPADHVQTVFDFVYSGGALCQYFGPMAQGQLLGEHAGGQTGKNEKRKSDGAKSHRADCTMRPFLVSPLVSE